jgi:acetylornithine deacetylase/succinyl-diaminopimelate desuccinylase-like protein
MHDRLQRALRRSMAAMSDLQREATELLQRLIRFNTVNPPGQERELQEFLADRLQGAGFETELLAADEARPNLIARLRGPQPGPTLGLLGHVDTVLADPAEWSHDPWSGELADGFVWGRGALDMKGQVAAEVAAAGALAREGWRPARGELLVLCVVDEETGSGCGARWLTEQQPEKVRCDLLINEGGGNVFDLDGRRYYGVCCAEKGIFRFTLTTEGVSGHASIPRMGDNALLKMAPLLQRLGEAPLQPALGDEPRALLSLLDGDGELDLEAAMGRLRELDPLLALVVEPTFGISLAPTKIRASEKVNVIPSQAHLQVDCRVPPGLGEAEVRARVEEVLGGDGYRLEFTEQVTGNRSPMDSPLMDEIRGWVGENAPGADVVPMMLPGFTDSRWFREAFPGCLAYGFFPHLHMTLHDTAPLIHGADERIDVRDLGFATRFFHDLPQRVLS